MKSNKIISSVLSILFFGVSLFSVMSCGGDEEPSISTEDIIPSTTLPSIDNSVITPSVDNSDEGEHIHNYVQIDKVDTTCTSDGYIVYQCEECFDLKNEVYEKAFNHKYTATVTEPTCKEQGYTTHVCEYCNHSYIDSYVETKNHNEVIDEGKEATCEEDGLTQGKHCLDCGEVLLKQEVIPALGHEYKETNRQDATCEEDGKVTYVCSHDSSHTYSDVINAKGHHEVVLESVEATCEEDGLTEGKYCDVCNKVLKKQEVVPAKGHEYKEVNRQDTTCEEDGKVTYVCSHDSSHTYSEVINAKGHHEVVLKSVEATCTKTGLTEGKYCDVCNKVLEKQEVVPEKGHNYNSVVTEPTCTNQGYTTHKCSNCNDSYIDTYVEAKGHSYSGAYDYDETYHWEYALCGHDANINVEEHTFNYEITKQPTETQTGEGVATCWCSYSYTYVIDKLEHTCDYQPVFKWNPDVAPELEVTFVCSKDESHILDSSEYTYSFYVIDRVDSSCSQKGYIIYSGYATYNGVTYYEDPTFELPLDPNTHTYDSVIIDPTCEKQGYTIYTCVDCDYSYETDYVKELGHKVVVDKAVKATCTDSGLTQGTHCERCEKTILKQKVIPAKGHNYNEVVTEPTCTEQGYTTHTCSECGTSYIDNYVEAKGHYYYGAFGYDETHHFEYALCGHDANINVEEHIFVYEVIKQPTETQTGEGVATCWCSYSYTYVIEPIGHTCDYQPVFKWYPNEANELEVTFVCSKESSHILSTSEYSYRYERVSYTAASCTMSGYISYIGYATYNGVTYQEEASFELKAIGHSYVSKTTAPTCDKQGYTTHTCEACGNFYIDSYTNSLGHDYQVFEYVEATCEEDGYTLYVCSHDSTHTYKEMSKSLGHIEVIDLGKEATCEQPGLSQGKHCSDCGKILIPQEEIKALGHDYVTYVEHDEQTHWYKEICNNCKNTITSDFYPHNENKIIVKEATENEEGLAKYTCDCGYSYEVVLPRLEHVHDYQAYFTWFLTEDIPFEVYLQCKGNCGHVLPGGDLDDIGWEILQQVEPTCEMDGYIDLYGYARHNGILYEKYDRHVLAAIGHNYSSEVIEATCEEQGYTLHTCSNCANSYTDNYVDALGHDCVSSLMHDDASHWFEEKCNNCDYVVNKNNEEHKYNSIVIKEATEEVEGLIRYYCYCGYEYDEVIPALDHVHDYSYNVEVIEPTCEEQGYTLYICRCGDSYEADYVAALGHKLSAYSIWDENTQEALDLTLSCENCDFTIFYNVGEFYTKVSEVIDATCEKEGTIIKESYVFYDDVKYDHIWFFSIPASHDYIDRVVYPTCEEQGYTTHTCEACGNSYIDSYTNSLGHDYQVFEYVEATCEEDGYTLYVCSHDSTHSYKEMSKSLGHIEVIDLGKEATCEQPGLSQGKHCSDCGKILIAQEEIKALGHDCVSSLMHDEASHWFEEKCNNCDYVVNKNNEEHKYNSIVIKEATEEVEGLIRYYCYCGYEYDEEIPALDHVHDYSYNVEVIEPTCETQGYTEHICRCGDSYRDNYIDAKGHLYVDIVVDPTCKSEGYTIHTCENCGHSFDDSYTDVLEHNYEVIARNDATCEVNGWIAYQCSNCGDNYSEKTYATGHNYSAVVIDPTCEEDGYTKHVCANCEHTYEDSYMPAIGHIYNSVVTEPTCEQQGYTTHTCENCAYSYIDSYIEPFGHQYNAIEFKHPTCEEEGYGIFVCDHDSSHRYEEYYYAIGHLYIPYPTEPTCEEEGYTTHICENCAHTYVDSYLPAIGHSYNSVVTEPTCEQQGYTTHTCEHCNDSFIDSYKDSLEHDYQEVEYKEATCEEDGYTLYECSNDSTHTYVVTYEAIGHSYTSITIDPTCEEQGYITHTCSECGSSYTQYIDSLGHDYIEEVKEPTCHEDGAGEGYTKYTCKRCDYSYKGNYVDKLPHQYYEVIVEPTCKEQGYTHHICENCNWTYKDNYVETLPHNYASTLVYSAYGHWYEDTCVDCGDWVERDYQEHEYSIKVVDPTCEEQGYTTYDCKHCDYSYESNYVDAHGHDYVLVEHQSANCILTGYSIYECSYDSSHTYEEIHGTTEHLNVVYDAAIAPTCTSTGLTEGSHCTDCGEIIIEQRIVEMLDHNYETVKTYPTCEEQGYTTYTCSECGDSYITDYVDARHSYDIYESVEPTCTEQGYDMYVCIYHPDQIYYEYKEPTGHFFAEFRYEPTCEHQGYTELICGSCGYSETYDYVEALGHDYQISEHVDATCEEQGYTTYVCSHDSSHTYTEIVEALGHSYVDYVCSNCEEYFCTLGLIFAPTYDFLGEVEYYTVTGYNGTDNDVIIPSYYEGVVVKGIGQLAFKNCASIVSVYIPQTVEGISNSIFIGCENLEKVVINGEIPFICQGAFYGCVSLKEIVIPESVSKIYDDAFKNCDSLEKIYFTGTEEQWNELLNENTYSGNDCVENAIIEFLYGHNLDEGIVIKDVTCEENGLISFTCLDCGKSTHKTILATGHIEVIDESVEATCLDTGLTEGSHCSKCNEVIIAQEIIPIVEHNYECSEIIMPTCDKRGYSKFSCVWCNKTKHDDYIEPLGHDFVDDVCDKCDSTYYTEGLYFKLSTDESYYILYNVDVNISSKVIIPERYNGKAVKSIGNEAFYGCSYMLEVHIPKTIEYIECNSFYSNANLSIITVDSDNPVYDSRDNCNAIIETNTNTLVLGCKNTVVPNSIVNIGDYAFAWCVGLENIELYEELISIGNFSFLGCHNLNNLTIPNSVEIIGEQAFSGCQSFTSISLGNGVKEIGLLAFNSCVLLEQVYIYNNVQYIGTSVFINCDMLSYIYYSGTSEQWNNIDIDSINDNLFNTNIMYNHTN